MLSHKEEGPLKMDLIITSAEQMKELGEQLAHLVRPGDVIYLSGDLGMGKTTLVQGIGQGLGCPGNITSPTFTLMNVYPGRLTLYHCDFYRLTGDDAEQLGIKELIGAEGLFVVEWSGTINPDILPAGLHLDMQLAGEDYDGPRRITIAADNGRGQAIIEELKKCHS